ncbi:KUP/HAK/KT family potassium transporter [Rhodoligotrophos defluvii]|uniref:KUP/HAK/KT family potassium transporter n=1 Tax=Rhodoligotrophos defluvii TaxID=2561934 RepID=UPI0010C9CC10
MPSFGIGSSRTPALTLAAIGIIFGDIGTSPIYALRIVFSEMSGLPYAEDTVLGALSVMIWSLILLVTVTYVTLLLRADNNGEGGVLALSSLLTRCNPGSRLRWVILLLSLVGASLFYGDGIITPAISVLSAVEGIEIIAPAFSHVVVPVAIAILVGLFAFQSRGTERVGRLFGPVMCVWFATLAVLGLIQIAQVPSIIRAISPHYAVLLFLNHPVPAFLALGGIVLAVTGVEALYADMGHFGRKPVRLAWYAVVGPALVLNYLGQGALVLREPAALSHPFFSLAPSWGQPFLVALATFATIIASQALISGLFSLTRQAVQLELLPRLEIRHTSPHEQGQVYLPAVNWLLMAAVIIVVLGFESSEKLATAYGIAVVSAMLVSAVLLMLVTINLWQWPPVLIAGFFSILFLVDFTFLAANSTKIRDGGWFPIIVGIAAFTTMSTWRRGRQALNRRIVRESLPLVDFVRGLKTSRVIRVPGTAVFLSRRSDVTPSALLHNMKHNKVLHERSITLTVVTEGVPTVPEHMAIEHEPLGQGMHRVVLHVGFMQTPSIPAALGRCTTLGTSVSMMDTSFFVSRETLMLSSHPELSAWRARLFIALFNVASDATQFYQLPRNRVVELGRQVEF